MRDLKVPEVEDPDRYFPEPVVLSVPPTRELEDGSLEMWIEGKERWESIHPVVRDILRGLEEGRPFDDLVASLPDYPDVNLVHPKLHRKVTRKLLWRLHRLGHVRFDLPDPPALFDGRYRHVRLLGRGGLGVAHLCEDMHRDAAPVVVKHPWGVKSDIRNGQRAIAREVAAYQHLGDHPNVPPYHGSFQEDGLLHLVRGYVDGRSLKRWFRRDAAGDRSRRFAMMEAVARALHRFHERGLLFLDEAPGNFMVEPGDRLVVPDLGTLAPLQGDRLPLRGARGTRGYQAPEVLGELEGEERHATVRSEVFSFGCLHYALVAGERPSGRWHHEDLLAAMRERGFPDEDHGIVAACCRDLPRDRPRDMLEVVELIRSVGGSP